METTITKRKDPKEFAAAKSDINSQLRNKVKETKAEAKDLDRQISDLKVAAVRESDPDKVVEMLAQCKQLEARREALPVLLRGFQVRALHAQSAALAEEAADIKPELDAAEAELETAKALVPELQKQLQEAEQALIEKTERRDQLQHSWSSLHNAAGLARADAGCIERGEPMKFQPNRFDGIID